MPKRYLLIVVAPLSALGCSDSGVAPEPEPPPAPAMATTFGGASGAPSSSVPLGGSYVGPAMAGAGGLETLPGQGGVATSGGPAVAGASGSGGSGTPASPDCLGMQMQPGPYSLPPEATVDPSAPVGQFLGYNPNKPTLQWSSTVYPNAHAPYWVYVPAGYDGTSQLPLIVLLEASSFANPNGHVRAPVVLDNLIYRAEFPPALVVFVNSSDPVDEYIADDDRQSAFLLGELLPLIGKDFSMTSEPTRRAIGGFGRGAVAALNVAWRHPDSFKYVIMTNGDFFPPSRDWGATVASSAKIDLMHVTLLSSPNDGSKQTSPGRFGGNAALAEAFANAGYPTRWLVGDGPHGSDHFGQAFPSVLRCLGW